MALVHLSDNGSRAVLYYTVLLIVAGLLAWYQPKDDNDNIKCESSYKFNSTPLLQTTSHYVYKGTMNESSSNNTISVVAKKWKTFKHYKYWNPSVNGYKEAQKLIDKWNQLSRINKEYVVKIPFESICMDNNDNELILTEYDTIEEYIEGNYQRYTSNSGYINNPNKSIHAFLHWTYHITNAKYMLSNAKGVRKDTKYYIINPTILSNTSWGNKYGITDLGEIGIKGFFENHKCNKFCSADWIKPSKDVLDAIDSSEIDNNKQSTTYIWDIKRLHNHHLYK